MPASTFLLLQLAHHACFDIMRTPGGRRLVSLRSSASRAERSFLSSRPPRPQARQYRKLRSRAFGSPMGGPSPGALCISKRQQVRHLHRGSAYEARHICMLAELSLLVSCRPEASCPAWACEGVHARIKALVTSDALAAKEHLGVTVCLVRQACMQACLHTISRASTSPQP